MGGTAPSRGQAYQREKRGILQSAHHGSRSAGRSTLCDMRCFKQFAQEIDVLFEKGQLRWATRPPSLSPWESSHGALSPGLLGGCVGGSLVTLAGSQPSWEWHPQSASTPRLRGPQVGFPGCCVSLSRGLVSSASPQAPGRTYFGREPWGGAQRFVLTALSDAHRSPRAAVLDPKIQAAGWSLEMNPRASKRQCLFSFPCCLEERRPRAGPWGLENWAAGHRGPVSPRRLLWPQSLPGSQAAFPA